MKITKFIQRQDGDFNYVNIILILFLVVLIWFGAVVIPRMYAEYQLTHFVEGQMIRAWELTASEMRRNILDQVQQLKIPLSDPDLNITKTNDKIKIEYTYVANFPIPGTKGVSKTIHQVGERRIRPVEHLSGQKEKAK